MSASSYGSRDQALYYWAADQKSPIDVVGFSLMPDFFGARTLSNDMREAQKWMHSFDAKPKPHWVFAAGGYPLAHGEKSQELALWGVLAWATSQPQIKGLIVSEAGDYEVLSGLRSANGRYRSAVGAIFRAEKGLAENSAR